MKIDDDHCVLFADCPHFSRPGYTYRSPDSFQPNIVVGYYLLQQQPVKMAMYQGKTGQTWKLLTGARIPPQALLAGVYTGAFLKGTKRADAASAGYVNGTLCPFTFQLTGPSFNAFYFRFQVCPALPQTPGMVAFQALALSWRDCFHCSSPSRS